jgi:hypothetical protein
MQKIKISTIRFPNIRLHPSAGHKLRGYFGNLFKDKSTLLHNHFADGGQIYGYPLVQYKVVKNLPILVGIEEGAQLLIELFLQMKELRLEDKIYPINAKNISSKQVESGVSSEELFQYQFQNIWLALNQSNYNKYKLSDETKQLDLLKRILISNMLSFFKGINYHENERILVKLKMAKTTTSKFKDKKMLAFSGTFISNVQLPDLIGLGKSVARGYGTIKKF